MARLYESTNRNRVTVLREIDRRLQAADQLRPSGYEPTGGAIDEAFDADGAARPGYDGVLTALDAASPAAAAEMIAAGVERDGIVHGAGDSAHPLAVDAVPRVFGAAEWARLEAGLEQRIGALEAFVADAFGAREAFRAGVVPADLLDRCAWFEDDVAALPQRGPRIAVAGPDIVRDASGELRVLEDNVRTPTLMTFAVAARRLVTAALPRRAAAAALRGRAAHGAARAGRRRRRRDPRPRARQHRVVGARAARHA